MTASFSCAAYTCLTWDRERMRHFDAKRNGHIQWVAPGSATADRYSSGGPASVCMRHSASAPAPSAASRLLSPGQKLSCAAGQGPCACRCHRALHEHHRFMKQRASLENLAVSRTCTGTHSQCCQAPTCLH